MEMVVHRLCRHDRDRPFFHVEIGGVAYFLGGIADRQVHMGDLCQRMYPGIGPATDIDRRRMAEEFRHRILNHALNADAVLLFLPADERSAMIFNRQLPALHR